MAGTVLTLARGAWYGWQALGTAVGEPTPVKIRAITPLKSGQGLLTVELLRLLGALQPAVREETWRVRWRGPGVLVAETVGTGVVQALAPLSAG